MIVGVKEVNGEKLITICDKNLIGKRLKFKDIEFYVNPKFYSGKEMKPDEVKKLLKNFTIINALGRESVSFLIRIGYVKNEDLVYIGNVPHAQVFFLPTFINRQN